uniref:Uncharacterized protein n=1 Tax=Rhipicephalus microplus TaxID=6941 RepID=A0A6G5AHL4_RHIMP
MWTIQIRVVKCKDFMLNCKNWAPRGGSPVLLRYWSSMNCFLYIYLFKAVYTDVLVKTSELKTSLEHDWPWEVLGSCAPITYNKFLNVVFEMPRLPSGASFQLCITRLY